MKESAGKGDYISQVIQYKKRIIRAVKLSAFLIQYFTKKFIFIVKPRLPQAKKAYAQHFPSVPLRRADGNHFFNFSSELIAVALVVIVAGFNIVYFGFFGASEVKGDESLAAKLLDYHSELNPELYAHHNAIKTIVLGKSIIPEAHAEDLEAVQNADAASVDDDSTLSFDIEDQALKKPSTGRIKGLVNIQIHTTQVGETLASISKQYNISVDTIKWANNLTNDTIKPGWYLKIPPVNGILLVVGANTTGPDIAHKYNANLKEIIAYNGLEDYNDFEKGDVIMVPNGKMPAAVAAAKPAKPGSTIKLPGKDTSLPKGKGHIFVSGQCTDYVARKFSAEGRAIEFGGNAKDWPANAKAYGATFDKNPVKGAILVTTDNRRYGHVAYIDSVNGNTVTISEWNYAGPYKLTKRTLSMSDSSVRGVIHYKE